MRCRLVLELLLPRVLAPAHVTQPAADGLCEARLGALASALGRRGAAELARSAGRRTRTSWSGTGWAWGAWAGGGAWCGGQKLVVDGKGLYEKAGRWGASSSVCICATRSFATLGSRRRRFTPPRPSVLVARARVWAVPGAAGGADDALHSALLAGGWLHGFGEVAC